MHIKYYFLYTLARQKGYLSKVVGNEACMGNVNVQAIRIVLDVDDEDFISRFVNASLAEVGLKLGC